MFGVDSMVTTSNGSTLVVVSSQGRELVWLDPATGGEQAVTSVYGSPMDQQSCLALSDDESIVYILLQDTTFGHSAAAAYSMQTHYQVLASPFSHPRFFPLLCPLSFPS
jgi:hypothetical protein